MIRLWLICFAIIFPFAVVPFVIKPVVGLSVVIVGAIVVRFILGWNLSKFFENFLEVDSSFEKDVYGMALLTTRNLALQNTHADLKVWISSSSEFSVKIFRDRRSNRIVIFSKTFLDQVSESELRKQIQKADQLTQHPRMLECSELFRLYVFLCQLKAERRTPVHFIYNAVLGLYVSATEKGLQKHKVLLDFMTPNINEDLQLALGRA